VAAAGAPADVVDAALVERVFGLAACIVDDPVTGTPLCVPARGVRRPLDTPLTEVP
jgi:iron complex transport system ATP-binding protein